MNLKDGGKAAVKPNILADRQSVVGHGGQKWQSEPELKVSKTGKKKKKAQIFLSYLGAFRKKNAGTFFARIYFEFQENPCERGSFA